MLIFTNTTYFRKYEKMEKNMNNIVKMLHYYNEHDANDSFHRIIKYLLLHPNNAEALSIKKISEASFVSNATVSRCIQFLGYESLSTFKKEMKQWEKQNPDYVFRNVDVPLILAKNDPKTFLQSYVDAVNKSLKDLIENLDIKKVDVLLSQIHNSEHIFILSSDSVIQYAQEIQRGLLLSNKLVSVNETENEISDLITQITDESLVIIISTFGNFLFENTVLLQNLHNKKCQLILLTQHFENMITTYFDMTLNINSNSSTEAGSYPISLFCEFLVRRYYVNYDH